MICKHFVCYFLQTISAHVCYAFFLCSETPDERTACQKLRDKVLKRKILGAYLPECTASGDFKPVQCSRGNPAMARCWCVDITGQHIKNTEKVKPESPDCCEYAQEGMSPSTF